MAAGWEKFKFKISELDKAEQDSALLKKRRGFVQKRDDW